MIVSDTAVRQRVSVMVLALIILIFGTYCYRVLPRESEPDITIPNVFVSTSYKGVASKDIETSITIEIEKKLKGLEGVKKIHSVSSEGLSSINIEFVTGTDIDDALQKVRDRVDEAKGELPTDQYGQYLKPEDMIVWFGLENKLDGIEKIYIKNELKRMIECELFALELESDY